ncbi:hypothetical protein SODG_005032 [Sodalis praecaptivus]
MLGFKNQILGFKNQQVEKYVFLYTYIRENSLNLFNLYITNHLTGFHPLSLWITSLPENTVDADFSPS